MDPLTTSSRGVQVVVVGAGLAGLAAAWHLGERGFRVTVLESERRPGGRASGVPLDGATVDPVSFRVTLAHHNLLGLVDATGVGRTLLPLRPLARAQIHAGRSCSVDPVGFLQVAALPGIPRREGLRLLRLGRLLRTRYARFLDARAPERAAPLDDRSVADFGRLYFGSRVVERWMEPELAERGLEDAEETSRAAFLVLHHAEHWFGPSTLRAPVQSLIDALADRVELRPATAAERVEPRPGGGFTVQVREAGRLHSLEADAVVLATPADEAARMGEAVLIEFERTALAGVRYAARITAMIEMSRPLTRLATRVRVPRAEGSPLAIVQLEPAARPGAAPDGLGFIYVEANGAWSAAHLDTPVETLAKELTGALGALFASDMPEIRSCQVQRIPGALPAFEVGRLRTLERLRQVSGELRRGGRRLYLAGDYWIAPSLEGAVTSGLRAADELVADLT